MNDYFENLSEFVRAEFSSRNERDLELYSIANIEKHWLGNSPKDFTLSIKHEILREMLGFEAWAKVFIDDPIVASTQLSKYNRNGEPITVKDICQIMLASVETVKKILVLANKYAEIKFPEEAG